MRLEPDVPVGHLDRACEIKRAILASAEKVVLVVDSTKIFSRAFCEFGRTEDLASS
jgi:DeoR/GlpR family transcriptional regulator of sugar metabolism